MDNNEFEMPIGFALSVGINQDAQKYYANLNINTKKQIKEYIKNNITGDEALEKINIAVNSLANNSLDFLN